MPRPAHVAPLICEHFVWRLIQRDGVFYADGRSADCNLGKHSLGTRDRNEALANLRKVDHAMAVKLGRAKAKASHAAADLSIEAGWNLYLEHYSRPRVLGGLTVGTCKRYRSARDKHVRFCNSNGWTSWNGVDDQNVEKYGERMTRESYAYRTIYLEVILIKSLVRWLIKKKLLPPENQLTLELNKPQGTDTFCYTREQVAAMVRHCDAKASLHWLRDLVVTLACTGLRIGEASSLRWSDVDLASGTIRLTDERASVRRRILGSARQIKSGRDRTVPIHPTLRETFSRMARNSELVFRGPRGGRLKPDTVRNILVRDVLAPLASAFPTASGEIGFKHGRVHSFRHFFCSEAFAGGASEADIRDWLGHSDSKMVAHYRHLAAEVSQRKMNAIDFLGEGLGHGA